MYTISSTSAKNVECKGVVFSNPADGSLSDSRRKYKKEKKMIHMSQARIHVRNFKFSTNYDIYTYKYYWYNIFVVYICEMKTWNFSWKVWKVEKFLPYVLSLFCEREV